MEIRDEEIDVNKMREAVYQQVATPVIATLERYIQAQIEAESFGHATR